MARTMDVDPIDLAGITHGVLLGSFADLHRAGRWLLGHDEVPDTAFARPAVAAMLRERVLLQFPSMPTAEPASVADGVAEVRRLYGASVALARGA